MRVAFDVFTCFGTDMVVMGLQVVVNTLYPPTNGGFW
jgi:hypothetical protein